MLAIVQKVWQYIKWSFKTHKEIKVKINNGLIIVAQTAVIVVLVFGARLLWQVSSKQSDEQIVVELARVDIEEFVDARIAPIIESLESGAYTVEEIQVKFDWLSQELKKLYDGYTVERHMSLTYYMNHSGVYSFSMIEDGKPVWGLIAPALMDKAAQIEEFSSEMTSEIFETFVAIQIIHELSKLTYLRDVEERTVENEYIVESYVWADLCEFILQPLVEKHQMAIDPEIYDWYYGWKMTGCEANEDWRRFVRDKFVHTE